MTQEEKAKAYDEAINTTRNLVKAGLIYEDAAIQIFPDFKKEESEDASLKIFLFFSCVFSFPTFPPPPLFLSPHGSTP